MALFVVLSKNLQGGLQESWEKDWKTKRWIPDFIIIKQADGGGGMGTG